MRRLFDRLTASHARRVALALALATLLALALVVLRTTVYHRGYTFLVWNLFLAWIPLGLAHLAAHVARPAAVVGPSRTVTRRLLAVALGLAWLAFLPNAPYIATDLMHLRTTRGAPLWLDVLAVGSAAACGVLLGLASTHVIHRAVGRSAVARVAWLVPLAASLAAGGGVYLGRVLRWNTWDILTRPSELLQSAWDAIFEARFAALALAFAVAFGVAYLVWALVVRGALGRASPPSASPSPSPSPGSGAPWPPRIDPPA
jgi:uncharacterized membrane protein